MPDPGTVFPIWHIAFTAAIVFLASLAVLRWRFREFSARDALLIALVAGFSVLAWRLAGNTGALNDDPIPPFSPNDVLCPVITYVSLGLAAGWLEYRNLRFYPSNLVLAAAQELTAVGVWYFVGRFLNAGASAQVEQFGGNYLAYILVGVLLNQVGLAALNGPFQTVSEAFWDKRLETYRLSIHGIWANVAGRLGWQVAFSTLLQLVALVVLLAIGGLRIAPHTNLALILVTYGLLLASNAGLGFAGASLFFLLEVKNGQDPITWSYRYLVMLVSGLYVPLAVLPAWLRGAGAVLPQTYAFAAARSLLLTGAGWDSPDVRSSLLGLTVAAAVTLTAGIWMLNTALRRAERRGGIGVVV